MQHENAACSEPQTAKFILDTLPDWMKRFASRAFRSCTPVTRLVLGKAQGLTQCLIPSFGVKFDQIVKRRPCTGCYDLVAEILLGERFRLGRFCPG